MNKTLIIFILFSTFVILQGLLLQRFKFVFQVLRNCTGTKIHISGCRAELRCWAYRENPDSLVLNCWNPQGDKK